MHEGLPHLSALRAFEAAARHLSMTKAAAELAVTPGALSHQIKALEAFLGVRLFERRVRAIALTAAGRQLYPGLNDGFARIREAVQRLRPPADPRVLVVSTPPGVTAKWLAPRLYRFAQAHPEIDVRISSTIANADFVTDGVDAAMRNLPVGAEPPPDLMVTPLIELHYAPVMSSALLASLGGRIERGHWPRLPLIHDESLIGRPRIPGWADWLARAGLADLDVDLTRGLRFSSADHAIEAAVEGAGVLLAANIMTFDDLRTGRLVQIDANVLSFGRELCFIAPRRKASTTRVAAFGSWLAEEMARTKALMPADAGLRHPSTRA